MTASILALSIALVGGYNFDSPPSLGVAVAAGVVVVLLPGLAYSVNRAIPLLAIAVVALATIALTIYVEAWVASCPDCTVGHDDSRDSAHAYAWLWFGILGVLAVGITLIGAGISAAASRLLRK